MTFENVLRYFVEGLFTVLLIFVSRVIPSVTQVSRQNAWKSFAKQANLTFVPGSFFSLRTENPPQIIGTYRKRPMVISAETHGKFGFLDSYTKIVIPIQNRLTAKFPRGCIFYILPPGLKTKFFQGFRSLGFQSISGSNYMVYSLPLNLGNSIGKHPAMRIITSSKSFVFLLIKEQNLYFQKKNVDSHCDSLQLLVDSLCDIADAFEEYSIAWIK